MLPPWAQEIWREVRTGKNCADDNSCKDSPKNSGKNCRIVKCKNCVDDICRRWSKAWDMMIFPKYVMINIQ